MNYGELDRSRWYGMEEPDLGSFSIYGARCLGRSSAQMVEQWMGMNSSRLPAQARYLGLAAGQAFAEMAFAGHLGISPRNTTLVDRTFALDVRARLEHPKSKPTLIDSGLFTYLAQATDRFDVITAFGVEYVFNGEAELKTLMTLAERVLNPDGYMAIVPCYAKFRNTRRWTKRPDIVHGLYLNFKNPTNLPKADES